MSFTSKKKKRKGAPRASPDPDVIWSKQSGKKERKTHINPSGHSAAKKGERKGDPARPGGRPEKRKGNWGSAKRGKRREEYHSSPDERRGKGKKKCRHSSRTFHAAPEESRKNRS